MPDKDRAYKGGWKSADTLRDVYDDVDPDGVLRVMEQRQPLRRAAGE